MVSFACDFRGFCKFNNMCHTLHCYDWPKLKLQNFNVSSKSYYSCKQVAMQYCNKNPRLGKELQPPLIGSQGDL